jgi:hypothetical protein
VILHRAGYDVWSWQDSALLRAFEWLHGPAAFPATGDDTWQSHLINYYYGTSFPAPVPSSPGKNVGWTDWTHGSRSAIRTGVHGRVENQALGVPVSGAEVQLRTGQQASYSVRTNAYGCYRFVNVGAGTYDLHCSSPGCADWAKSLTVPSDRQLFGQDIELEAAGSDTVAPAAPTGLRQLQTGQ